VGVGIRGLENATCPHCRRTMIGGCYSTCERQEMQCLHCGGWAVFNMAHIVWQKAAWYRHAPDEGMPTHDTAAWDAAVNEVGAL